MAVYRVRPTGEVLAVSSYRRRSGLVFDRFGTLVSDDSSGGGAVRVDEDALQAILSDDHLQCTKVELPKPEESGPDPEWVKLAAIYEQQEGKKPSNKMKLDTLRTKVEAYGVVDG